MADAQAAQEAEQQAKTAADAEAADKLLQEARSLDRANKAAKALETYRKVVSAYPDAPAAKQASDRVRVMTKPKKR